MTEKRSLAKKKGSHPRAIYVLRGAYTTERQKTVSNFGGIAAMNCIRKRDSIKCARGHMFSWDPHKHVWSRQAVVPSDSVAHAVVSELVAPGDLWYGSRSLSTHGGMGSHCAGKPSAASGNK